MESMDTSLYEEAREEYHKLKKEIKLLRKKVQVMFKDLKIRREKSFEDQMGTVVSRVKDISTMNSELEEYQKLQRNGSEFLEGITSLQIESKLKVQKRKDC